MYKSHIIFNEKLQESQSECTAKMPLVTAAVTTYKRETSIVKRAVSSILNQTYPCIELFVVNDDPSNGELENNIADMLRSLNTEKEIHYIVVEENGGACKARNIALHEGHGKYIAYLDDDDEWKSEKIEKYVAAAEKDSKIGLVYGATIIRNENTGTEICYASDTMPSGDIFLHLLAYNIIGSCSCPMLRKTVMNKVGGFGEDMPALQDWELYLRMLQHCDAAYVSDPLNVYCKYAGERISTNPARRVVAYEKLLAQYQKELENNLKSAASFYMMGCYFYGLNLDLKKGFSFWCKAVARNPFALKKNSFELIKLFARPIVHSKNI